MRPLKGTVRMRKTATTVSTALLLAVAALAAANPAAAQDYRFGAGWYVGGAWFSPLNGGATGTADDLKFDPGWMAGLQFEEWLGTTGRLGIRVNGAVSQRPLSTPDGKRDIGLWLLDADFLIRFLPADADRLVNVFFSGGAGLARYSLGRGSSVVWESADASYDGNPSVQLAAAGGFGVDALTPLTWDDEPIGVRFELVDHVVFNSPFDPISGGGFDPIHNIRFVIGVFTGFGLRR